MKIIVDKAATTAIAIFPSKIVTPYKSRRQFVIVPSFNAEDRIWRSDGSKTDIYG
jgi:hypothetical protein